jgi:hypothetical protein
MPPIHPCPLKVVIECLDYYYAWAVVNDQLPDPVMKAGLGWTNCGLDTMLDKAFLLWVAVRLSVQAVTHVCG